MALACKSYATHPLCNSPPPPLPPLAFLDLSFPPVSSPDTKGCVEDIFKFGSTEPSARLFDATRMFEVRESMA